MNTYDVIIVGAGPAGLSAAVNCAAEGYHTLVAEADKIGGQVFGSSRVENVIGWPVGIPGYALMEQAHQQAQRLGAEFITGRADALFADHETRSSLPAVGIGGPIDGDVYHAKAIVLATGVRTRKLTAPGCEELEGKGVWYMTTPRSEEACLLRPAVVVGAGNSAGQAAVHLASQSPQVVIVCRGKSLRDSMSAYLVDRIERTPNINVRYGARIDECSEAGGGINVRLQFVDGDPTTLNAGGVYVMIGATPSVEWAGVKLDADGYVLADDFRTSLEGVFAVGDIRSGSVKRVASAAGEGAGVMRHINRVMRPELYR